MPERRGAWARHAAGFGLLLGVALLLLLAWLDVMLFATLGHPVPPPLPGMTPPRISPAWRTIILANAIYGGGSAVVLGLSFWAWRRR
jgi:heme A synthase